MMTYGPFRRGAAPFAGALAFAVLLGTAAMTPAAAQSPLNEDPLQDRPSNSPSQAGEVPDSPEINRDTSNESLDELRRRNDSHQNVAPAGRRTPATEPQGGSPALGDPRLPDSGNSTDPSAAGRAPPR
jgi:hypothetical protein